MKNLNIDITGSGEVNYRGNPKYRIQNIWFWPDKQIVKRPNVAYIPAKAAVCIGWKTIGFQRILLRLLANTGKRCYTARCHHRAVLLDGWKRPA